MASAPSASALSAVLRCRGNIFNKKRPGSGYSLGPKCGTPGEPVASSACAESRQPRLGWRALLFGGHAEARDGIPVVIRWQLLRKVLTDRSREAGAPVSGRHRRTEAQIPCKRSAAAPASAGRGPKRGSGFADTVLLALGPGKGTSPREPRNGRIAGAALDQSAPKTCLFVQCLLKSKGFSDDYGPPVRLRAAWAYLKGGCSLLNALLSDLLRRRFIVADGSRCIHGIFKVDDQRATFAKSQDPSSSYNDCHTVIGFKGRRRPTSLEVEGGSPKSTSCPKTSTVSGK